MSDPTPTPSPRRYWRSLEQRNLEQREDHAAAGETREFPDGADELEMDGVSRREFLGIMGASMALTGMTGCDLIRKPEERILPYAQRPEDLLPGEPRFFATCAQVGGSTLGLLVESQDGRPTKIEGNPNHPMSGGGTNAWAQADVLDLYDPDRSRAPRSGGAPTSWAAANDSLSALVQAAEANAGAGFALLLGHRRSPTLGRMLGELKQRLPRMRTFVHDATDPLHAREASALLGMKGVRAMPNVGAAKVILALDSDFLGVEGDVVRSSREFADGRRLKKPGDGMNRLWVVEPSFTMTGASADHRQRMPRSRVRPFLEALVRGLLEGGLTAPRGADAAWRALSSDSPQGVSPKWFNALVDDLKKHAGTSLVLVGQAQPPEVHALAHLLNAMLGAVGRTVTYHRDTLEPADAGTIAQLAQAIDAGEVETLVSLGVNAVYDAPADLDMAARIGQVATSVHHGRQFDETGAACSWHLPASHYLEAWGDHRASDGTAAVQQPLIAPLYDTISEAEVVARMLGRGDASGYELVRETWKASPGFSEAEWQRWLHDGIVKDAPTRAVAPRFRWGGLARALADSPSSSGLEIAFNVDPCVLDGRYANNAWMQEVPDPMTKIAWDSAACLSPATAAENGVETGDVIRLEAGGQSLEIAACIQPGMADGTVVVPLGYGRTAAGRVGDGVGFDASVLRSSDSPWLATGASLQRTGDKHELPSTQEHGTLIEPSTGNVRDSLYREGNLHDYLVDGKFVPFVEAKEVLDESHIHSLWHEPNETGGQQWGMAIDLNACTGCNACTIACQSENNISVVGRERVADGREMHWIRLDRYFTDTGDDDETEAVFQPIPCMQCENAPCEQVCPVAATVHSPDGLNDMAYNRCIGTRYCANNCPYKVRRFNYFNFAKENDTENPMAKAQRNPDVTVRFRGVMEKCTYCVQRINSAKIDAKVHGDGKVPDGELQTACQQVCPSKAITFGDINDPKSAVAKAKKQERDYVMLRELNAKPRTSFLARVRNPHPDLAPPPMELDLGGHGDDGHGHGHGDEHGVGH